MNKAMEKDLDQASIDSLWEQLFRMQREACKGELCLLDKLQYNDICDQLRQLGALKE